MEWVELIEDLDVRGFCAQGTVGAGGLIPTFIVLFPPAGSLRTTRDGSTRSRSSSCRSMCSRKCSGASSWRASKRCTRSTNSASTEHSPCFRIRRPSRRGFVRCSASHGWFIPNVHSAERNTRYVVPEAEPAEKPASSPRPLWTCPQCGWPMVLIERLSSIALRFRSPPVPTGLQQ